MQNKNTKTQSIEQEKGFGLLRSDTIQLWVWLEGYQPIDEQSLKSLSEDVSYRCRETSDCAISNMHHCKRSILKVSDLNKAFKISNIEKTYGYSNKDPFSYNIISSNDLNDKILKNFKTDFLELNNDFIKLCLPEDTFQNNSTHTLSNNTGFKEIYGKWILANGNYIKYESKTSLDNCNINLGIEDNLFNYEDFDIENELFIQPLNNTYKKYFDTVTSIILGYYEDFENDNEYLITILNDLRTNSKLQPLLSYLINFISQTIQILTNSPSNKSSIISKINIAYIQRVIEVLKNLILNKNVFLAPKGFFSKITSCLLFSTIQNSNFVKNTDGLILREKSSFVLVMFLKLYQRFSINTIRYILKQYFIPHFNKVSEDLASLSKLHIFYGIINCLIYFGGQIIDEFHSKLILLQKIIDNQDNQEEINTIVSATLLNCLSFHFKWKIKKLETNLTNSFFTFKKVLELYTQLYDLYGDSFIFHIFNINGKHRDNKILDDHSSYNFKIKFIDISLFKCNNKVEYLDAFEKIYAPLKSNKIITINFGKNLKIKNYDNNGISKLIKTDNIAYIGKIKKHKENYQYCHTLFY